MVGGRRIIHFHQDILEDLADFTGMPIESIQPYFDQSKCDHTRIELDQFVQPQTLSELIWYYRCCRSEFVHNSTKYATTGKGWPLLDKGWIKQEDLILDYGAGTGQNCFYLKKIGAIPTYFEISIIQMEFFRFRCERRRINIEIIKPYTLLEEGYKFDPIHSIRGTWDVVLLSQVLEHIPEPLVLLEY